MPLIKICIYVFVHLWNNFPYSGVEGINKKLLL